MLYETDFPRPQGSFRIPVAPPDVDPFAGELVTVCFSRAWLPYVLGSLLQLLLQSTWLVSNPDELEAALLRASTLISFFEGSCPDFTKPTFGEAFLQEYPMFRTVCEDNKCFLEFQCCPGEWVRLANADQLTGASQPSPNSSNPPPPAGGGTQQTCAKLNANGTLLLPTLVNTGDTITLNSANGAGWDGGEFDFGPLWRLPNGDQYVGGLDVGFPRTDSGDPINTVDHMTIIAAIGSTPVYLALPIGSAATVPAGVANAQVYLQVNDSAIGNNQGSYDVCVTVKNNQTPGWKHDFDFTVSSHSWLFKNNAGTGINFGTWSPGGFKSVFNASGNPTPQDNDLDVYFANAGSITAWSMTIDVPDTTSWGLQADSDIHGSGGVSIASGSVGAGVHTVNFVGSASWSSNIVMGTFNADLSENTATLISAHFEGTGVDPF